MSDPETNPSTLPTSGEAWEGVMVTYTEQDFPTSKPYERTVPGWQCRTCGQKIGTLGLPPRQCSKCGTKNRVAHEDRHSECDGLWVGGVCSRCDAMCLCSRCEELRKTKA